MASREYTSTQRPPVRAEYPEGYAPARTALAFDTHCLRCGAIIGDAAIHDAWHRRTDA